MEVGSSHVAHKQGVARQHRIRVRLAAIEIEHEQRHRFTRMAWRLERFDAHAAEINRITVVQGQKRVLRLGGGA